MPQDKMDWIKYVDLNTEDLFLWNCGNVFINKNCSSYLPCSKSLLQKFFRNIFCTEDTFHTFVFVPVKDESNKLYVWRLLNE